MNLREHLSVGLSQWGKILLVIIVAGSAFLTLNMFLKHSLEPVLAQQKSGTQAQAGTIAIRPTSATIELGERVTVEVWLEDVADYYGVDLRFSFDPDLVNVPSGEVTPLWDVFDENYSFFLLNEADNVEGAVAYAVTNLNPAEPFTGTGRVCAVTFAGLATGTATLDFTYVQGATRRGTGLYPVEINGQITVTEVINTPPNANPDAATVDEDSADNAIDVLANDDDPDGDGLSVASVTEPAHGSATNIVTDVVYTPDTDFCGSDAFTYTVADGRGGTDSAAVSITVSCLNDAPTAYDDTFTVEEDSSDNAIDVLQNDSDPDAGDTLSITAVTEPVHGSAINNVTDAAYTPDPDFCGGDTFTYTVSDGRGGSDSAAVSITVTCLSDPPTAVSDTATVDEDSADNAIDVLANDSDPDAGDTLTITAITDPHHGSAINNVTEVAYTPDPDFCGADAFTYTVSDGRGGTDSAAVSITVSCLNDAPTADDDTATVDEDSADNVIDVLQNDSDPDAGDTLTITAITDPHHGSAINNVTDVAYTPDPNFCGGDAFTYTVSDGHGGSDSATVSITVSCLNDAPVADAGGPYSGYQTDLVTLDGSGSSDVDGTIVTYTWQVDDTTVASGASLTHELSLADYTVGEHTVTLVVTDDQRASGEDAALLTVGNLAPTATDDSIETDEDVPATIDVTGNDDDPDGTIDARTVALVDGPSHGSAEVHPTTGVVTYTPNVNYAGRDAFCYTVKDDQGTTSNEATVSITIEEINDPPLAIADDAETGKNEAVGIDVTANDSDVDGTVDASTVSIVTEPAHGSITLTASGVVTYAPSADYVGTDVFTYTVRDEDGAASNEAVVTVTINPAPIISHLDPLSVTAGAPAFTLTVRGANFVTTSSVRWGGESRPTTFVSETQLLATISAADVAVEGVIEVTVFNPAPYGGISNAHPFEIAKPGGAIYLPLLGKDF